MILGRESKKSFKTFFQFRNKISQLGLCSADRTSSSSAISQPKAVRSISVSFLPHFVFVLTAAAGSDRSRSSSATTAAARPACSARRSAPSLEDDKHPQKSPRRSAPTAQKVVTSRDRADVVPCDPTALHP